MSDTIFALSSGALPAGIAVVRVSGPAAGKAALALCGGKPLPPPRSLALRTLRSMGGDMIDEALVAVFPEPNTVTGEELVELHCHGGRAVVARLLEELGRQPALRLAQPGEFTRRALENGRIDLTEAEGLADLLAAETEWQRRAALMQSGGALRRQVEAWRDRLVLLSAQAEAAIDYVDEEETSIDLVSLVADSRALAGEWSELIACPSAELLQSGVRVVLAGPPNAGKSSLFNALVGTEKAIVTPHAGTTRDLIEARLDMNGLPVTLIDTAGLRDSEDEVERIGIDRAQEAQRSADILLWLGDPEHAPHHPELVLVHARADARNDEPPADSIATSIARGVGLDEVAREVVRRAERRLPPPEQLTLNQRQRAALKVAHDALVMVRDDLLLTAECLRQALHALDALSGRQSTEDVLDALFGRFCLGK